jgi:hypothetical protein
MRTLAAESAVRTLSGFAGYDGDKQCNREAQHWLLRRMVSVFGQSSIEQFVGRWHRLGDTHFEIWLKANLAAVRLIQTSSSAKADYPVFQGVEIEPRSRGVLDTRLRGYDGFR